ncbi:MAG: hypothetical protein P8P29_08480 [Flavobacteriaceae bacterium]|nr:hypothetical protein [Flavobacteriaceae bacterium]
MNTRGVGKNKKFLLKRLQDMYGESFHPIIRMAERANDLDNLATTEPDAITLKASIDAWDKIANYTEPKLKAVEVSSDEQGLTVSIQRKRYDGSSDIDTEQ